jgi:site-specific DNA recombinase
MRAVIYARFSTDKQSDNSIEDQARNCERYAERQGMNIVSRYEDKAISGTSKNRAGFKAMTIASYNNEFDVLLVDDLSRLSRDDIEMKQVIRGFKFRRIRIVGVSDGYDSDTKGEKIQSTMRGLMNEMYLDDLREKTHRGLYGKAMNGFSAGGRTYGYKRVPIESTTRKDISGRPEIEAVRREINEDEAQWVRQIFEWYVQGNSPKNIAHKLNKLGVPSARGSTWAANAIYGDFKDGTGLLNNQLYIGQYIWNRSAWVKDPDTGKRRRLKRDSKEWVITDLPELRILPQPLWDAAQARHQEIRQRSTALREALNNPKSRSHAGKFLFSGLLQCGCCGAHYTIYSTTSYGCSFNINRGDVACSNKLRVPRKLLEERLIDAIKNELLSEEAIDLFIEETTKILHLRNKNGNATSAANKRSLSQAEKKIANLMNAIKAGIVTPTTKAELEKAEVEYERAKAAMNAATGMQEVLTTFLPNAAERYRKLINNLGSALQTDIGFARQCLKTLLGCVKLVPSTTGSFLEAELRHSPEGLIKLALNNDIGFKARLVAGTRYLRIAWNKIFLDIANNA